MRFSPLFVFMLLVVAVAMPQAAQAEFTIATVDINRVLNESKDSQAKRKELDKLSTSAKKKVESRREELKKVEDKIKAGKIERTSKEADEFRVEAREFARYVKDTQEDLKREFLKSNKVLTEKVLKKVKEYARRKDLDLVLDKSSQGRSAVLFGSSTADITDDIIGMMNS